jgi:saccharopine dehydrogenase (NAD+, L-lysine-forming)
VPGRFARSFAFPHGERRGAFIPWGDVVTAPRSTAAQRVRTFFLLPPGKVRSLHLAWPLTALASRTSVLRRRLAWSAERAPEGPAAEERAAATFVILAEASDASGRTQRGMVHGRDLYGLTAATSARAALAVSRGSVHRHGVLTPSQAFDLETFLQPLVERFELRWHVF